MSRVSQVAASLHWVMEERAHELARESGCVQRQRKFSGADLLLIFIFGFRQQPDARMEPLASTALSCGKCR